MKTRFSFSLLLVSVAPVLAQDAAILHYWDFDTLVGGVPVDVIGELPTEIRDSSAAGDLVLENATYGEAYPSSGNYLQTQIDTNGTWSGAGNANDDTVHNDHLRATLSGDAMNFGTGNFSYSYWSYNQTDDEGGTGDDIRGPRIFDTLSGTNTGIQLGSNLTGIFNYRMDGNAGGSVLSNNSLAISQGADVWTLVAVNVDRSTNTTEIFLYDGAGGLADGSQGTYDISALTGDILPSQGFMEIGAINGGGNGAGMQDAGLDDLAFYEGLLSAQQIADLLAGGIPSTVAPPPPPPPVVPVGHFWDFDTVTGFLPDDLYGGLATSEVGFTDLSTIPAYGEAYPGAGSALNSLFMLTDHIVAETYSGGAPIALDFGSGSFAISFWSYNDTADGSAFGPAVFDCLLGDTTGIELGTDDSGNFNLRIDDNADNSIVSNEVAGFEAVQQPNDQWVHVVLNIDRDNDELTIFFNGIAIPEGVIDLSALTGNIFCTQDLELGVRNSGGGSGGSEDSSLDDFAIYPGLLSAQQVADLAEADTDPLSLLASFEPLPPIPIVSVTRDGGTGELAVVFSSANGSIYSVFGGEDLSDSANWAEITTGDLAGNGLDLTFPFTPAGEPAEFYFQVRED